MREPSTIVPSVRRRLGRRTCLAVAAALTAVTAATSSAGAASAATGIDVSGHQHPNGRAIDWSAVASSGTDFVYVKATEGAGYRNPYYAGDVEGAKAARLLRGAYHYARPSKSPGIAASAAAQARGFVAVAGRARGAGDLPPVLDLESSGGLTPSQLRAWTRTFLTTTQALTGRRPVIYTARYFWQGAMGGTTEFRSYPLWVANYGVSRPQLFGGWTSWLFWQTTASGTSPGIRGAVDRDVYSGTTASLRALANLAPAGNAAAASRTTMRVSSTRVRPGVALRLSGRLSTSGSAAGRTIEVWARNVGATRWYKVDTTRTTATGSFSVVRHPRHSVRYFVAFQGARGIAASRSTATTVWMG